MQIGEYILEANLLAAPMAGVSDRPFRQLCRLWGAGLAVSEMVSARPDLRNTIKSRRRMDHQGETEPRAVQIVGAEPAMMADAARYNVEHGAQIIDINMGCPAKKVCNKLAGSALLQNEKLVAQILEAVVAAVAVPVTLKIRTGWDPGHRNGPRVARIAQECGIAALAVHGRTRACRFRGAVEYETIRMIKENTDIPVIANGDIDSPRKARAVLDQTGADGLMLGRSIQGRPWLIDQIARYLAGDERLYEPDWNTQKQTVLSHIEQIHEFYGEPFGVRIARKHIAWYVKDLPEGGEFRQSINRIETAQEQLDRITLFYDAMGAGVKLAA